VQGKGDRYKQYGREKRYCLRCTKSGIWNLGIESQGESNLDDEINLESGIRNLELILKMFNVQSSILNARPGIYAD